MAIGKQTTEIRWDAGVLDAAGAFVRLTAEAGNFFNAWNITHGFRPEYLGAESITTLSGYKKQGIVAYRPYLTVNLKNTSRAEAQKIQNLLNTVGTWATPNRPGDFSSIARDRPTVFRVSPSESNTFSYVYNLDTSAIEIQRELTINNQIISLSFSGVDVVNTIPNSAIV
jgi:hypothetical protein